MKIQAGNYSEIELPQCVIDEICQSGSNDNAVAHWKERLKFPSLESMFKEISEYADYDHIKDSEEVVKDYYLWIMAWNCFDGD